MPPGASKAEPERSTAPRAIRPRQERPHAPEMPRVGVPTHRVTAGGDPPSGPAGTALPGPPKLAAGRRAAVTIPHGAAPHRLPQSCEGNRAVTQRQAPAWRRPGSPLPPSSPQLSSPSLRSPPFPSLLLSSPPLPSHLLSSPHRQAARARGGGGSVPAALPPAALWQRQSTHPPLPPPPPSPPRPPPSPLPAAVPRTVTARSCALWR